MQKSDITRVLPAVRERLERHATEMVIVNTQRLQIAVSMLEASTHLKRLKELSATDEPLTIEEEREAAELVEYYGLDLPENPA